MFGINLIALLLVGGLLVLGYLLKLSFSSLPPPYFRYSNLRPFPSPSPTNWIALPSQLYQAALLLFAFALIDPYQTLPPHQTSINPTQGPPKEGIAIFLVLDQSGSMSKPPRPGGSLSKMTLSKQVSEHFIMSRPSDLIGLVSFARIPHVLVPLTFDKSTLLEELKKVDIVKQKDEDGTGMGYAIFKTAHLIAATRHFAQDLEEQARPAYDIKNTIMIVVTDGFQDPNPLDKGNRLRTIELEEAAQYAKSEKIKLYIVNVDPRFNQTEFAPHRKVIEKMTQETGGAFFIVSDREDLQHIFATIDQLEKDKIPVPLLASMPRHRSLAPFLIALGIFCFLSAFFLSTTYFRQVP